MVIKNGSHGLVGSHYISKLVICFFDVSFRVDYAFSRNPECRFFVSSSKDNDLRIWDSVLFRTVRVLAGHTASVTCVRWGGDGLIYSSSQDRTIKVWRAEDVSFISTCHIFFRLIEPFREFFAGHWKDTVIGSIRWH